MKKFVLIITSFLFTIEIFAQSEIEYFPAGHHIQPFTANVLEPKLGFISEIEESELRLDIGNSMDIVLISLENNLSLSFGADMFTYTLLRSEKDFHFPVDAVDYLFGINAGLKIKTANYSCGARLRISHISAHFVDGHYDGTKSRWRDGLNPRVYSREFVELVPFFEISNFRFYTGLTYLFHVDPSEFGKGIYQAGLDYFAEEILGKHFTPFFGYDVKLLNITAFTANHSIEGGIKIGTSRGRGFRVYLQYYSGKSIHGEYFDRTKKFTALGFNLDL